MYFKLFMGRKQLVRRLVANGYGLCTGMALGVETDENPPITPWLADLIDDIAGKDQEPLTFRDLHGAKVPSSISRLMNGAGDRSIDYRAVTTCITFGRPIELPFSKKIFAFDPAEFGRYFPKRIVDFMVKKSAGIGDAEDLRKDGKLPLPGLDLPIVVAARMSLSFPVLFTMIPLWSVDYHDPNKPLKRVWFSDGGITSNFPIHRFDSLFPRWPTLGINLQYTDSSNVPQRRKLRTASPTEYVYLPSNRSSGILDLWNGFDASAGKKKSFLGEEGARFGGFLRGIFNSAKNWHDNSFLVLPSFRDRVGEIWLTPDEGGLNLNMDTETISKLINRGRDTGRMLVHRFADLDPAETMSWQGHRWARFRSGIAGLTEDLLRFEKTAKIPSMGSATLEELLSELGAPPAYKFKSESQRAGAQAATMALLDCIAEIASQGGDESPYGPFGAGPRPPVDYGARGRF